ncbi:MAG: haloalkane dehalogenase [Natronomonas sp.]|jgi:haloalkane dehalogenase|uniref:alpha/beta fold hydrolase n=1 Tax=Natronomonas sp. TaxID=2184060 RepID=UPI003989C479
MNHEEWSAAQTETSVTVDGHDLSVAYYEGGDPADETLVFVHGVPTWSFLWRGVAPEFEDDYHVVVPDLLGYGNSASHDGFGRSIRAQEGMLEDLLDGLGQETVTLVAHDIGGGAALRFAAHSPERVDRFVASNIVCYDSWPVEFIVNLGLPDTAGMDDEEFEGQLDFAFAEGAYGEADPEFVEGMKAPWLREGGKRAISRAAVSTNTNHTMEIPYEDIDADLLCLWAKDDVMQPIEYGERLADDVGGKVVELDDAFHWVVEDRTETYREELRQFLTETDTKGGSE